MQLSAFPNAELVLQGVSEMNSVQAKKFKNIGCFIAKNALRNDLLKVLHFAGIMVYI